MMTELSLNVLDVAENSTRAGAGLVEISVRISEAENRLRIVIKDDGCGMTEEQVARVIDPFYTSRSTRKVGLGVPFFREAALLTGGSFDIASTPGKGTCVTAVFLLDSIDRMPLGDMSATIHNLIVFHPQTDFVYTYQFDQQSFTLDTRQMKEILEEVSLDRPEVSTFIKSYLEENHMEANQGRVV